MFVSVGSCYFREPACHHFVNLQGQGVGEAALFGGRTQEEQSTQHILLAHHRALRAYNDVRLLLPEAPSSQW